MTSDRLFRSRATLAVRLPLIDCVKYAIDLDETYERAITKSGFEGCNRHRSNGLR